MQVSLQGKKMNREIKKIILITILLCLATSITALEISSKGFKLGINFARSTGEFIDDTKYKTGFIGGIFVSSRISDYFFIQPELLFSMKGYKIKSDDVDIKVTFSYIELPVLIKYELILEQFPKTELFFGPAFSFIIDARYKSKSGEETYSGKIENINPFDRGIVVGINIQKKINQKNIINFDLRYNFGLMSWNDLREFNPECYNRVFSGMLGFSF